MSPNKFAIYLVACFCTQWRRREEQEGKSIRCFLLNYKAENVQQKDELWDDRMQEDQYNHQEVSTEQDRAYSKRGHLESFVFVSKNPIFPSLPK